MDNQLCLWYSQLKCYWDTHLPGVVASLSGWVGPGTTSAICLSMIQLPCVGRGRPGSKVNKTLHLRTQIE